jgi:hypothetical protein
MWWAIIPAIPKRITIESHISFGDVLHRVRGLRNKTDACTLDLSAAGIARMRYEGLVSESGFTMRPILPIRDGGYRLTVRGTVEPCAAGSRVLITFQARFWSAILLGICVLQAVVLLSAARMHPGS